MLRDPHLIGGLQKSSWRSHWLSPSPSRESHSLFENWSKVGKIFFINWNCKKLFLEKTYVKQNIKTASFFKKMEFFIYFLYFLWFFELFFFKIPKKICEFSTASTAKFCYTIVKIGIFPWNYDIFCPMEKSENHQKVLCLACGSGRSFSPWNPVFSRFGFSLDNSVALHPNSPKCIRNDWIPSLLGQDRLWLL